MKTNYNLGIWVSNKTWHIIKIEHPVTDSFASKTLCNNKLDHFFCNVPYNSIAGPNPKWIYPYYIPSAEVKYRKISVTKKTLCKTCLKISKLSWNDIAQYLINIKVGAISAENSKIKQNKITPKLS